MNKKMIFGAITMVAGMVGGVLMILTGKKEAVDAGQKEESPED